MHAYAIIRILAFTKTEHLLPYIALKCCDRGAMCSLYVLLEASHLNAPASS